MLYKHFVSGKADGGACQVCEGTGWMAYPHPDGEGGLGGTAVGPCPACIQDGLCSQCGRGTMDWGVLRICVHCGFTFDEAEPPAPGGNVII